MTTRLVVRTKCVVRQRTNGTTDSSATAAAAATRMMIRTSACESPSGTFADANDATKTVAIAARTGTSRTFQCGCRSKTISSLSSSSRFGYPMRRSLKVVAHPPTARWPVHSPPGSVGVLR
jgi:hypothetical protein